MLLLRHVPVTVRLHGDLTHLASRYSPPTSRITPTAIPHYDITPRIPYPPLMRSRRSLRIETTHFR